LGYFTLYFLLTWSLEFTCFCITTIVNESAILFCMFCRSFHQTMTFNKITARSCFKLKYRLIHYFPNLYLKINIKCRISNENKIKKFPRVDWKRRLKISAAWVHLKPAVNTIQSVFVTLPWITQQNLGHFPFPNIIYDSSTSQI